MAPTFNGLSLAVADMATSLSFYRRLGLEFPADADNAPHAEATLPGGSRLMLDTLETMKSFDPDFTAAPGGPMLAFLCADATEVDDVYADLVAAGHTAAMAPFDADWGQRYAKIHDPDGYTVDLFAWINPPA